MRISGAFSTRLSTNVFTSRWIFSGDFRILGTSFIHTERPLSTKRMWLCTNGVTSCRPFHRRENLWISPRAGVPVGVGRIAPLAPVVPGCYNRSRRLQPTAHEGGKRKCLIYKGLSCC
jgi:hypothetical protein